MGTQSRLNRRLYAPDPPTPSRGGVERMPALPPDYHWLDIEAGQHRFLQPVFDAFGFRALRVWTEAGVSRAGFSRARCEGLVTALGDCDGRPVAISWSDFRVKAASLGHSNSRRFTAFLRQLRRSPDPTPLVYVASSAGVSLMEGRTAFSDAFEIWPELLRYSEERLLLTCAAGRCLGLAPLLYGLGHYRVAVAGSTEVNLTGPEVIKLFFGKGYDFDQRASVERCVEHHDLVHELVPSVEAAMALFRGLIARSPAVEPVGAPAGPRTGALLNRILDPGARELMPGGCPRVRLFVGTRGGLPLGVFVNPLERSNNMVTVRTLEKYAAGLDLFRALRLPIVSLLDSPGIDPRFDECDANNIRRILSVGERIIHYPHGAMCVIAGRCFGGASTLAFPKVFGGCRAVALRGAQAGMMDGRIVDQVLSGCPRLQAQWREVASRQGPDFADLLENGTLDAVIEPADLSAEVDRFLVYAASRLTASRRPRGRLR